MRNPLERRLLIGEVDHTFDPEQESKLLPQDELDALRAKHEIFPDAQMRFEKTIKANNYELVKELENGIPYPPLNDWLDRQLSEQGWARIYPCYVRDKETSELLFCKARIKPKEDWGGLEAEAAVLNHIPTHAPVPRIIKYVPENDETGQLEILLTEAVKISEGSVLPAHEWTVDHVRDAATQIKQLETIPLKNLPEPMQKLAETVQSVFDRSYDVLQAEFRQTVEALLREYDVQAKPIFVHGDTWLKNIIVSTDASNPQTLFVDWERGGAGYRGQDAGRLWWNLWQNPLARRTLAEVFLSEPDSSMRAARSIQLKFGVVFEALRWLTNCSEVLKSIDKKKEHDRIRSEIDPIQQKARAMLETVDEIA